MKNRLEPIADQESTILILGTLPGDKTLKENEVVNDKGKPQYYRSSSNRFWKIIASLESDGVVLEDDVERIKCLERQHIALWDVCKSANREKSLDKNIKGCFFDYESMVCFLQQHPNIKTVVFNGKKASKIFSKRFQRKVKSLLAPRKIEFLPPLLSSSGANRRPTDVVVRVWKEALARLL